MVCVTDVRRVTPKTCVTRAHNITWSPKMFGKMSNTYNWGLNMIELFINNFNPTQYDTQKHQSHSYVLRPVYTMGFPMGHPMGHPMGYPLQSECPTESPQFTR
jgi:hypothetical protein